MKNHSDTTQIELPRYRCHKEVHALQIRDIIFDRDVAEKEGRETDGTVTLHFHNEAYTPKKMPHAWASKHSPLLKDGYYVVYADGYASFSPKEAFEGGYTLIT